MLIKSIYWKIWGGLNNSKISFWSNLSLKCKLQGFNLIERNSTLKAVSLGMYSYVAFESILDRCSIGKYCSIGPRCLIGLASHPLNGKSTHPIFYSRQNFWKDLISSNKHSYQNIRDIKSYTVSIGNDVWIGAGVMVLDGVKIGDGAIIAAGSVVIKDIEPYSINAGVPSKKIKQRKCASQVEKSEFNWYNYSNKELRDEWDSFKV
jgi:acetyltransferase-like isoleucine patch superfamily enzyme